MHLKSAGTSSTSVNPNKWIRNTQSILRILLLVDALNFCQSVLLHLPLNTIKYTHLLDSRKVGNLLTVHVFYVYFFNKTLLALKDLCEVQCIFSKFFRSKPTACMLAKIDWFRHSFFQLSNICEFKWSTISIDDSNCIA